MLYSDFEELMDSVPMRTSQAGTGAVLMGRTTFDMAGDPDSCAVDHEYRVPSFVLAHRPPEREPARSEDLYVRFVTDGLEPAVAQATAAGDKAVTVLEGAELHRQLLTAPGSPTNSGSTSCRCSSAADGGLLAGVRFEKIGIEDVGARTSLGFRVPR